VTDACPGSGRREWGGHGGRRGIPRRRGREDEDLLCGSGGSGGVGGGGKEAEGGVKFEDTIGSEVLAYEEGSGAGAEEGKRWGQRIATRVGIGLDRR
jgi:hypothetical protein